jgi:hypothetical protein
MNITSSLFESYLKCPTKCFIRSGEESSTENAYAKLVRTISEAYRDSEIARLKDRFPSYCILVSPNTGDLKAAEWLLTVNINLRPRKFFLACYPWSGR